MPPLCNSFHYIGFCFREWSEISGEGGGEWGGDFKLSNENDVTLHSDAINKSTAVFYGLYSYRP